MKQILISLVILIPYQFAFCQISNPTDIPQNVLWLMADSCIRTDSLVSQWIDLSGNNNDVFQNNINNKPKYISSSINEKPSIRFDGVDDFFSGGDILDMREKGFDFYIVAKVNSTKGALISKYLNVSDDIYALGYYTNNFYYSFYNNNIVLNNAAGQFKIYNPKTSILELRNKLFINCIDIGLYKTINQKDRNTSANFKIGGSDDVFGFFDGEICEIIIYDTLLNDSCRDLLEQYLHNKYAPPVNLGSDIFIFDNLCDTSLTIGPGYSNIIWSTGDTSSTISVSQSGVYYVYATNIFGKTSSDEINVIYPISLLSDTTICLFDTIFWNTNLNHDYNFLWSTGSSDSLIAIYEAGDYYVQIVDSFGCSYMTDTITVTIDSFPQIASLGPDIEICSGNYLSLLTGVAETFLWSTGDTTESIVINTPGIYSVTVSDYMGCNKADTIDILIKGEAPVPGFVNTITCFGDSTYFTDSSYTTDNSNIISWNWEFADMTTSSMQNPAKLFSDTGLFAVTLTIETDSGCTNYITEYVKVYPLPQTGFYQNGFCENTNIQFFDTSICANGSVVAWDWDFGNSQISAFQNPFTQFNSEGDYLLTLITYSDIGCSDTLIKNITIKNSPLASFKTSLKCSGTGISFTDLSTYNPINQIIQWNWSFDDGNVSEDQNPVHLFNSSGLFNITQIIHSLNGCTDTVSEQIFINASPVSDFPDSVACSENLHSFENNSSVQAGVITDYLWIINDSINLSGPNPQYFFSDTGFYSVELIVISDSLCSDTLIKDFYLFDLPDPEFSFNPYYGIVLHPMQFTCNQTETNYSWSFGDGFVTEDSDPIHTYLDSGLFNITHYSLDTNGCRDSVSKQLSVLYPNCDIISSALTYTQDNNYIEVCAEIANFGNIPVTEMDLLVHLNDESQIKETWTGLLIPGAVMIYCFNGQYNVTDNFILELICVFANPTEYTDINLFNNEYCISHSDDFNLFDIYPNPAQSEIFFSVVLPEVKDIIYSVYDKNAKLILKNEGNITVTGYNKFSIDISDFSDGSYTLQVEYSGTKKTKQFIVNR